MEPARGSVSAFTERWKVDAADRPRCRDCVIRGLVFCGQVPPDLLDDLERSRDALLVGEGQTLFLEGDPSASYFLVRGGALRLYKLLPDGRRQITAFALPGDWLGLSNSSRYVHNVQAIVPSTLCEFSRQSMDTLSSRFSKVAERWHEQRRVSLAASQEQILMLGRMNPLEKLSRFLVDLLDRQNAAGLSGNPVYLPMSRADIADFLGITIETVSRSMSRLKASELIEPLDRNRVQVRDLSRLREAAGY